MPNDPYQDWEAYKDRELAWIVPALSAQGYALEETQPHVSGERYLMQAVTTESGRKLILLGTRTADGMRVVIKATSDAGGIRELLHERLCRSRLADLRFAYRGFLVPEELLFTHANGRAISIQKFIEQESTFLARPTPDQFTLALAAFKTQEGAHAATYEHMRTIAKTYGIMRAPDYLEHFRAFEATVAASGVTEAVEALRQAAPILSRAVDTISQYEDFLTHTDFVPHNIRIVGSDTYLLDASSLRFGNKYEGWARFINFMELYNPALARALEQYVLDNRAPEESASLRLMRIYRLGEILAYYTRAFLNSTGDLNALNRARIVFWTSVLQSVMSQSPLPDAVRTEYQTVRDALRSPEEKLRQKDLH